MQFLKVFLPLAAFLLFLNPFSCVSGEEIELSKAETTKPYSADTILIVPKKQAEPETQQKEMSAEAIEAERYIKNAEILLTARSTNEETKKAISNYSLDLYRKAYHIYPLDIRPVIAIFGSKQTDAESDMQFAEEVSGFNNSLGAYMKALRSSISGCSEEMLNCIHELQKEYPNYSGFRLMEGMNVLFKSSKDRLEGNGGRRTEEVIPLFVRAAECCEYGGPSWAYTRAMLRFSKETKKIDDVDFFVDAIEVPLSLQGIAHYILVTLYDDIKDRENAGRCADVLLEDIGQKNRQIIRAAEKEGWNSDFIVEFGLSPDGRPSGPAFYSLLSGQEKYMHGLYDVRVSYRYLIEKNSMSVYFLYPIF